MAYIIFTKVDAFRFRWLRALFARSYRTFVTEIETRCVKRMQRHHWSIFQIPHAAYL